MNADEWKEEMKIRENLKRNEQFESEQNLSDAVDMRLVLQYADDSDELTLRCGLDFVARYYDELRAMVDRLCFRYYRQDLADDMFSDAVVDYAEHAFASFNPAINDDRKGYVFARLHFYCRKWFERYHKRHGRGVGTPHVADDTVALDVDHADDAIFRTRGFRELATADISDAATREAIAKYKREISALLDADESISLLDSLPPRDEQVVRMHCQYGFTFAEIADKIGGAESTLRVQYNDAITALQRLVLRHDNASRKT